MKFSASSLVIANPEVVSCELAGGRALLNLTSGIYYNLNDVGGAVWETVAQPTSFGDLTNFIFERYDVPRETIEADLVVLLSGMFNAGLVTVSDADAV